MSGKALPFERWDWAMRIPVPGSGSQGLAQRCALLILAKHADADGTCRVSHPRLRKFMCVGKNTMINALAALEADGLIAREAVYGPNPHSGRTERKTDITRLNFARAAAPEGLPDKPTGRPKVCPEPSVGLNPGDEPREIQTALKEPSEGANEGESAREAFDRIFASLPEASRKGSSPKRMHEEWQRLERPPTPADLIAAAEAYTASGLKPQLAHYWIKDHTFAGFLRSDEDVWWGRMQEWKQTGAWCWGPRPVEDGCPCPVGVITGTWRSAYEYWRNSRTWVEGAWGPPPTDPRCRMPVNLLQNTPTNRDYVPSGPVVSTISNRRQAQ